MVATEVYVTPSSDERGVTLHLVGEIDAQTAPTFLRHARGALAEGTGPIAVDCARLTFIDASGLGVLVHLAKEARRQDRIVCLRDVLPAFSRILRISGVAWLCEDEGRVLSPGA